MEDNFLVCVPRILLLFIWVAMFTAGKFSADSSNGWNQLNWGLSATVSNNISEKRGKNNMAYESWLKQAFFRTEMFHIGNDCSQPPKTNKNDRNVKSD